MFKGSPSESRKMAPETWPYALGSEDISKEGVSVELGPLTGPPRLAWVLGAGLAQSQSS